ncbi:ABC transporter substrate-binding protein [Desulfoferrobacter suflitae]|uniref:ABC transporter substrate-binding protein n=1 Tax=Desulfoferrobacter suflitae TaxID=2865782 RepID=UPI00216449F2|nr:ABC transporter substrate-binding protein [Desulfoferrobacter suflitae]MCK8604026.1 ABC transporter substrate-binding protein [Desulfoferrobacter suflitae]
MMGSLKKLLGLAIVLAALPVWAQDAVEVGSITPLSGKLAVYGEGFQRAMNLALEEVNAAGGIQGKPLKIIFEDNGSTSQGSVSAIQKLITVHKVPIIFGPAASSNFLAICPIAQQNKVVLIGAESAAADISQCGSYVFRVFPSDILQGRGGAELAKELGYRKVVLTYINNDWGVGLAEAFKDSFTESGGEIIDEFPHEEGKSDYRSEILRIKQSNAPAVVNLTYIKEGAAMLKQAFEMKVKTQWIMGSASKSPKLVEIAGEAAEGIIGTYPTFSQDTPQYQHFKTAWEKAYPESKIGVFAEYNYDMVNLTAKALNLAVESTPEALREALMEAGKGYQGVTGDKTFDENGDVGAVYGKWTVTDGKIVDYRK